MFWALVLTSNFILSASPCVRCTHSGVGRPERVPMHWFHQPFHHARISRTIFTHHISTFPYSIFCSLFNHISSRPTSHTRHNPMFDQLNVEQVGIWNEGEFELLVSFRMQTAEGRALSLEPIFYPQSSPFFFCSASALLWIPLIKLRTINDPLLRVGIFENWKKKIWNEGSYKSVKS